MIESAKSALATAIENDPRWALVQTRDKKADGTFYYAVSTTGVYCKPSCAARCARPENITFHANCAEAERAGFRACKRCKPNLPDLGETQAKIVADICHLIERGIEESEQEMHLQILADKTGLSIYHFHRVFKSITGLTPKAYAAAYRAKKVRTELSKKSTITEAIFAAGYQSSSRFYEKSTQVLGMSPSNYKAGGNKVNIKFAVGECSLGSILVASSERGVCAILLGSNPEELIQNLQDIFPRAQLIGADRDYEILISQVVGYLQAPVFGQDFIKHLPLDIRGTAFQQRVWQALQKIPMGATVSYTDIARLIGSPKAVRAVAGACAANIIAIAIPCHRVVRNDGALAGYRWGVERKRALLTLEANS